MPPFLPTAFTAGLSDGRDEAEGVVADRLVEILEAARARAYYDEAMPLVGMVDRQSRPSLRALISIYSHLLERIERKNYDVFTERVALSGMTKSWLVLRALVE